MTLMRFAPALILLTTIFVGIRLLYGIRASAMRALALKWGFQYSKGQPIVFYLPKHHSPKPASFRLHGYPVDTLNRTWNLIEGEKDGLKVLILDSTLSMASGGQFERYPYSTLLVRRRSARKTGLAVKTPWRTSSYRKGDFAGVSMQGQ